MSQTPAAERYREAFNRFCRPQEERIYRYYNRREFWCVTLEGSTVPSPFKTKKLASEYLDGSDEMILRRLREAKEREEIAAIDLAEFRGRQVKAATEFVDRRTRPVLRANEIVFCEAIDVDRAAVGRSGGVWVKLSLLRPQEDAPIELTIQKGDLRHFRAL
jgi:hypothetical protein